VPLHFALRWSYRHVKPRLLPLSTLPNALEGTRHTMTPPGVGVVSWYQDAPRDAAGQAARPLLLVHSVNAAASAYEVKPLYDYFRGTRPVYALDLPGFGLSERSRRPYTPRVMTDAIHALVAQIQIAHGPGPVDAIALSLGTEFLARAAAENPSAFRSLGLVSPTGFNRLRLREGAPGSNLGAARLYALIGRPAVGAWLFRQLTRRPVIAYFLRRTWGSRNIDQGLLDYDFAITRPPGSEHAPLRFLTAYLFSADSGTIYRSLTHPVWVVHGVRGDFVNYKGLTAFAGNPRWTVDVLPTGALPHFEMLKEFVERYETWSLRIGASGQ
jgi:pimeloyl-ACP methyl ester carboxylesterase